DVDSVDFRPSPGERRRDRVAYPITPFPRSLCGGRDPEPALPQYTAGESFPRSPLGRWHVVRKLGFRIAVVPLYPVLYFPSTASEVSYAGGDLELHLRTVGRSPLYRGFPGDLEETLPLTEASAEDRAALSTYPIARRAGGVDYLAI